MQIKPTLIPVDKAYIHPRHDKNHAGCSESNTQLIQSNRYYGGILLAPNRQAADIRLIPKKC